MRIIFLDIDSVIITWRSHFARPDWSKKSWIHPDPVICNFLINLIKMSETPLRIVVSSSWRFNEQDTKDLFSLIGLLKYWHDDWRTTVYEEQGGAIAQARTRGSEIAEWLSRHPEVKDYRIIDDDTDMLPNQFDKFIKCDGWDGLGGREMKQLIDWSRGRKEA